MKKTLLALIVSLATSTANAAIYTFPDFTRPAGGAGLTQTFDFVPNEGWSGTPPNAISGEESLYLTMTVSWLAASDIGTFQARFNVNDDAGAPRWGIGKSAGGTSGFEFITGNSISDVDGTGPGTARPAIAPIDTTAITSVTLVLKVDQLQAAITPPATVPASSFDRWYGDIVTPGAQDFAAGFMWINPNLAAAEESQPTVWGAWRSGQTSYQGVSFITDTTDAALNFSNIALYTGTDTPFAAIPEPGSMALICLSGLGGLVVLRRRRQA